MKKIICLFVSMIILCLSVTSIWANSSSAAEFRLNGFSYDPQGNYQSTSGTYTLIGNYTISPDEELAVLNIVESTTDDVQKMTVALNPIMENVYYRKVADGNEIYLDLTSENVIISIGNKNLVYSFGGNRARIEAELTQQQLVSISPNTEIQPRYTTGRIAINNNYNFFKAEVGYCVPVNEDGTPGIPSLVFLVRTKGDYPLRKVQTVEIEGVVNSPYRVVGVAPTGGGAATGFVELLQYALGYSGFNLPAFGITTSGTVEGLDGYDFSLSVGTQWNNLNGSEGVAAAVYLDRNVTACPFTEAHINMSYYETGLGSFYPGLTLSVE